MKNKSFDCVKIKHDIQQTLRKEYAGASSGEIERRRFERIEKSPVLRKYIRDFDFAVTESRGREFADRT